MSDMPKRKVYGQFVVRTLYSDEEVQRVDVHYAHGTRDWEAVQRGMIVGFDLNKLYFRWEESNSE